MGRMEGTLNTPDAKRSPGPPQKVGHWAAYNALRKGDDFAGLALAKERDVIAELEQEGVDVLLVRDAVRLQTTADLFFDAILAASQQGDVDKIANYLSKYSSLTQRAMTTWKDIRELEQRADGSNLIIDAMAAAQEVDNDKD